MTIYYLIGRAIRPIAAVIFYIHARTFGHRRSRVVVVNESGEVLLLRTWAGRRAWEFPGGSIKRNEDPRAAARRELLEETGIAMPLEDFIFLATLKADGYEASVYQVKIARNRLRPKAHNQLEITDIGWYSKAALPEVAPMVGEMLKRLAAKK